MENMILWLAGSTGAIMLLMSLVAIALLEAGNVLRAQEAGGALGALAIIGLSLLLGAIITAIAKE